jgi:putative transposase
MARLARIVLPGIPHHVTQRGNRRETTFFSDDDYRVYLALLKQAAGKAEVSIWAYCLMPNHVHAIVVPSDEGGLRRTFADLHRRYTGYINARNRYTGHLWQGRFGAVAMDEAHLINAVRYVSLNPVRARLVARGEDWPWSSVRAHLAGKDDGVVTVAPVLDRVGPFQAFLDEPFDEVANFEALRRAEKIGRPVGSADWIAAVEQQLRRPIARRKPGPRAKREADADSGDLLSKLAP